MVQPLKPDLEKDKDLLKKPFFFQGNNRQAVLLIHGWTATSYEVRRLGVFLNKHGYTCHAPLLRGHGTRPEDLDGVHWEEWRDDIQQCYDSLKKSHDEVYLAGTSIGSNIALLVAQNNPDVSGLVLMATPVRFRFHALVTLVVPLLYRLKKWHRKKYPPTFGSRSTITRIISYQKYSMNSVQEVLKIMRASRQALPAVKQPVLIMQSTTDHILQARSALYIKRHIGSEIAKIKWVHRAYHTFISDIRNEHVLEEILDFLLEN